MRPVDQSSKRTPWLALLGLIIVPAVFLFASWSHALNNNILDLLPDSNESPEAMAARSMLSQRLSYPVILKGVAPGVDRLTLAAAFTRAAAQPAFGKPFVIGDSSYQDALLPVLKKYREPLFSASWLASKQLEFNSTGQSPDEFIDWLANNSAKQLNLFLDRPESLAYAEEIPADPLLLLPHALAQLPPTPHADDEALIAWIPFTVDPLTPEGQNSIDDALDSIYTAIKTEFPSYTQVASGVYDLAQASAKQTKDEVAWLNIEMVCAILILLLILAGRPGFLLLTIAPVIVSGLWCLSAGILIFGHIHVVALAVSSVVLGLAVDYAVHLAAKRGDGNLKDAWFAVRLPLATSCISTCFGFFFLFLSPIAALKQVGVMVPAGLLSALLAVRFLLPWLEPIAGAYRLRAILERPGPAIARRVWIPAAGLIWLAAMAMLMQGTPFSDDIRDFQAPIEESLSRYRDLADSIHHRDVNERWYCYATSPVELLQRLETVRKYVQLSGLQLPTVDSQTWDDFASKSARFADAFNKALEDQGFDAESFSPFFEQLNHAAQWDSPDRLNNALEALVAELHGPMQAILMTDGDVWVAVFEAPPKSKIPKELADFTNELAQQNMLNRALERAREGIVRSAKWGFLGIALCVFILFRKRGLMALSVPTWSVTLGIVATMLIGNPLGILAVIGAVLAFCLALDYGAFAATSNKPPASIRISAATTFCAFTILSFCSMPAVAQLGQVVAASVFFAWLGAELLCLPANITPKKSFPS